MPCYSPSTLYRNDSNTMESSITMFHLLIHTACVRVDVREMPHDVLGLGTSFFGFSESQCGPEENTVNTGHAAF